MPSSPGMQTLDAVRNYLIAQGVGQGDSKVDWPIFVGVMQDGAPGVADRAICLYETPGMPADPAWKITYPSMQVMLRGKPDEYTGLRNKAQEVFNALHGADEVLGTAFVYFYCKQSAPIQMGQDERRRMSMAWNFRSERNTPE